MITREQRIEAYRKAGPVVADMYGSMETANVLASIRSKYSIPPGPLFIDLVGDIILGLRDRGTLEQALIAEIKLPPNNAHAVASELRGLFDKASGTVAVPDANINAKEKLELRPENAALINTETGAARPLTRDELMSALGAKRTMASDMEAVRQKNEGGTPQGSH